MYQVARKPSFIRSVALLGLLSCANCSSNDDETEDDGQSDASPLVATTTYGAVKGFQQDSVLAFKGIRYGADTAATRFEAPSKPAPWTDTLDAVAYGASCPQTPTGNPGGLFSSWAPDPEPAMSEDCLFLNVWTPALADNGERAVMVWLHGGGFASGSGSAQAYDGARLAARGDVVVVTVNHRLNVFGYLALNHYGEGFADSASAGILDLILALEWVQDNAAAFGGNPKNVTIFGESGGGAKVSTLLSTEAAQGLFHGAIVQSGALLSFPDAEQARAAADTVVANLGLTPATIADIKTLPTETIREAFADTGAATAPTIDGRTLKRHPFAPDAPPTAMDVPLMLGSNRTENSLFAGAVNPALFDLTWEALPAALAGLYPDLDVAALIAGYRALQPDSDPSDVFFEATTDSRYLAGHRLQAQRKAEQGGAPTWLYLFNWDTPVQEGKWRCPHALEIGFVFDNVAKSESMSGTGEQQQQVADIMAETWLAFAKHGDPNNDLLPTWPAYELPTRSAMVLDESPEQVDDPRVEQLSLFGDLDSGDYGSRY